MMREEFPIFQKHPHLIYLDSAATAHKPAVVIEALRKFYAEDYATVHRAAYRSAVHATEQYNTTRETARKFLNASSVEEIVFTRGTTDALNLVALSWGRTFIKAGDELLVSEMEHHSNLVCWQMLAQATGAKLCIIPMDENGILHWESLITERTRLIAIGHVSNVTGTVNPIADIARKKRNAILVVDGAQAAPHQIVDVQALGCDFYAFSGHKCYGPTGVGVLYGKKSLLEQMPPLQGGGDMIERVDLTSSSYQEPPVRFEAGTPSIGSVIALKAALDWMQTVGLSEIASHGQKLLSLATQGLKTIPGLSILGQAPEKGPIVTFQIQNAHPLDIATLLDLKNVAIRSGHLCAQPCLRKFGCQSAARASFGIYNTLQDIQNFIDRLSQVVRII